MAPTVFTVEELLPLLADVARLVQAGALQVRRQAHEQRYNFAHGLPVAIGLVSLATTLALKPIFLNWHRY
jgi:hypothetical protein